MRLSNVGTLNSWRTRSLQLTSSFSIGILCSKLRRQNSFAGVTPLLWSLALKGSRLENKPWPDTTVSGRWQIRPYPPRPLQKTKWTTGRKCIEKGQHFQRGVCSADVEDPQLQTHLRTRCNEMMSCRRGWGSRKWEIRGACRVRRPQDVEGGLVTLPAGVRGGGGCVWG